MMTARELKGVALIAGFILVLMSLFLRKGERIKGVAFFAGWLRAPAMFSSASGRKGCSSS
jgi:hypothetical protein